MSDAKPRVGDVGTIFKLTIVDQDGTAVDVSTAASMTMYFKKPNGEVITKTALIHDGAHGIIKYTTVAGDLDVAGRWEVQGKVVFTSGTAENKSTIEGFDVGENLT